MENEFDIGELKIQKAEWAPEVLPKESITIYGNNSGNLVITFGEHRMLDVAEKICSTRKARRFLKKYGIVITREV